MLFNSYIFILLFFPLSLAGFWVLSQRHRISVCRKNRCSEPGCSEPGCNRTGHGALGAKIWLIGFSFIFYAYFNVKYLILLFVLMAVNYASHCGIVRMRQRAGHTKPVPTDNNEKSSAGSLSGVELESSAGSLSGIDTELSESGHQCQIIMVVAVIFDLIILAYFKYTNFFISSVNSIFKMNFMLKNIILPLGISFIVFQQINFVVQTYRGRRSKNHVRQLNNKALDVGISSTDGTRTEKLISVNGSSYLVLTKSISFMDYVLFTIFFPSISAGPITTPEEMIPRFDAIGTKCIDGETFVRGFILFVLGLSKKMLLADRIGVGVDYGWANEMSMQGPSCFVLMLLYAFQLYFDFSGYCDMGRGIAQMLGMDLPINFNSPYKAVNIVDFWDRWHITLSRFLRDNLYIPLGGNRKGKVRTDMNLFLVYMLSGLWHGAGWTYVLWGVLNGLLYVPTKAYLAWKKRMASERKPEEGERKNSEDERESRKNVGFIAKLRYTGSVFLMFMFFCFSCIYFRAPSVSSGSGMIARMFNGYPLVDRGLGRAFDSGILWYAVEMLHLDGHGYSEYLIMYLFLAISFLVVFVLRKNAAEYAKTIKLNAGTAILFAVLLVICIMSMSNVTSFIYYKF